MNNTTPLRRALLDASTKQLENVIDWLDRPWAPNENDALRAAWHEAERSDGARRALAYAVEETVRSLSAERDVAHVSQKLGLSTRTADAVATEIARRLGVVDLAWPPPGSSELLVAALRATVDIAQLLIGGGRHGHHRHGHRRHRHGR